MRILFVTREYPPRTSAGGIATYLATVAPALAARGHDVHVLCCEAGLEAFDEEMALVSVHWRPLIGRFLDRDHRGGLVSRAVLSFLPSRWLRGALSAAWHHFRLSARFDVIQFANWGGEGFVLSHTTRAAIATGVFTSHLLTCLLNERGVRRQDRIVGWMERLVVARSDVVISDSRLLLDELAGPPDSYRIEPTRAEVVPLSVRTRPADSPRGDTSPTVLQVGRLEHRKQPQVTLRAMALVTLAVPEASVVFVGRPDGLLDGLEPMTALRAMAEELGVSAHFVGAVSEEELETLYSAARVVVQPSSFESFGLASAEALSWGTPIVISERCGLGELIPGGASYCRIIPVGSDRALASAIVHYLQAADRTEVAEGARRFSEALDPDRIAERLEGLYAEIALKARSGRSHQ